VTCVNVDLTGNGNATPEGVSFPGPYIGDVPGIFFNIYTTPADNYVSRTRITLRIRTPKPNPK
jgi:hypothetical protein